MSESEFVPENKEESVESESRAGGDGTIKC